MTKKVKKNRPLFQVIINRILGKSGFQFNFTFKIIFITKLVKKNVNREKKVPLFEIKRTTFFQYSIYNQFKNYFYPLSLINHQIKIYFKKI